MTIRVSTCVTHVTETENIMKLNITLCHAAQTERRSIYIPTAFADYSHEINKEAAGDKAGHPAILHEYYALKCCILSAGSRSTLRARLSLPVRCLFAAPPFVSRSRVMLFSSYYFYGTYCQTL